MSENPPLFRELTLTTEERSRWISFHDRAYKEDLKMASIVIPESPRWSIIMAYYAMHNVSKLYLAKNHNLKISGSDVHAQTIFFISKYVKRDAQRIVPLLKKAKEEYDAITSSSVWVIPQLLSKGRDERVKTQYYNPSKSKKSIMEHMQAAQYFMDNFTAPYIRILEGLL